MFRDGLVSRAGYCGFDSATLPFGRLFADHVISWVHDLTTPTYMLHIFNLYWFRPTLGISWASYCICPSQSLTTQPYCSAAVVLPYLSWGPVRLKRVTAARVLPKG